MANPYSLAFGKEPTQCISRIECIEHIKGEFLSENPEHYAYMLSGVRGSGKTVTMTEIARSLSEERDWVTIELNPNADMLTALASSLYSEHSLYEIFRSAKLNLTFLGLGVEFTSSPPITDAMVAVRELLAHMRKHGKKLLVTIDEATSSREMKVFAGAFQIFLRQDLPIYLVMTGLYKNLNALANDETLTFLYRTPRMEMQPLNLTAIERNDRKNLEVSQDVAKEMALLTNGYSFAFQVLGNLYYKKQTCLEDILEDYDYYLAEMVFQKIWTELSEGDRKLARVIAMTDSSRVIDIRENGGYSNGQYNPYAKRLKNEGLLMEDGYGRVKFVLPRFAEYVLAQGE